MIRVISNNISLEKQTLTVCGYLFRSCVLFAYTLIDYLNLIVIDYEHLAHILCKNAGISSFEYKQVLASSLMANDIINTSKNDYMRRE